MILKDIMFWTSAIAEEKETSEEAFAEARRLRQVHSGLSLSIPVPALIDGEEGSP